MASKINISKITNANIYLEATNLIGTASEISIPEVTAKVQEHIALGMIGGIELVSGFEKMEGEITWTRLYDDIFTLTANPYQAQTLTVRSNVERWQGEGLVEETAMVTTLVVTFKKTQGLNLKPHESVTMETPFSCTAITQLINGKPTLEVDYFNNIFKVNGVSILDNFNANIGG